MSISLKTQKMLWGRAASRCAFLDCKTELVMDATETDDESLIGEVCHIVAKNEGGPRGDTELAPEQRDKYPNLLLLCNVHHKVIDDQPVHYTVEYLVDMKKKHEEWVRDQLATFNPKKQKDEEIYVTYIEQFEHKLNIANWDTWTSHLLAHGQPRISKEQFRNLEELFSWIFKRIWPKRYEELEAAVINFGNVLQDFLNVFSEHSVDWGENDLIIEKYYKNVPYNESTHDQLVHEWEEYCALIEDLVLELNRAGNYLFDKTREYLISNYRLEEGALVVMSGPHFDLSWKKYRAEYRGDERSVSPYPGLEQFRNEVRFGRDFYFGRQQA